MYKLKIVAGPNRGTSYAVSVGETSIGRQGGNVIVLHSAKISKRHCMLRVDSAGEVEVIDQGSANGTFVNGVLTKSKVVEPGDKIAVGEYVLELVKPKRKRLDQAPALQGLNNVLQFPIQLETGKVKSPDNSVVPAAPQMDINESMANTVPADLPGKAMFYFERRVMPFFYSLNMKHEWRAMLGLLGFALVFGNMLLSVQPVIDSGRAALVREAGQRARFMAKQIVEKNAPILAAGAETKTDVGTMDREDGVRMAVLMDLDSRIIAPGEKLNQYLSGGPEARFAVKARDAFRKGRESGMVGEADSSTVVAVEPVKIFNSQRAKNETIGMALVSLDSTLSTPGAGEVGMVYSETFLFTAILSILILVILYRLTLKPFEVLNDDIDKVLKGSMGQVTHEFRNKDLNSLWDVINSALQRVPRNSESGDGFGGGGAEMQISPEEYSGPLKAFAEMTGIGLIVCDSSRKISFLNPMFEEISGIRAEGALGQDIPAVARDQSFGVLSTDLMDRAQPGGEGVAEDFEFSGIQFRVQVLAFGSMGSTPRCFAVLVQRKEG